MKKITAILFILSILSLSVNQASAKWRYRIYEVTKVTEQTISLERKTENIDVNTRETNYGKTITVTIDRSRRPGLKVGDKVQYDKTRDILGKTLLKK